MEKAILYKVFNRRPQSVNTVNAVSKDVGEISLFKFRQGVLQDMAIMFVLFVLSVYVVYFTSQEIAKLFFLLLLSVFFFSKKDYLWFAYFFIIAQGPGYFFAKYSGSTQYRIPLYTFLPGMSFTPIDLFFLIALLKAFDHGTRQHLRLKVPLLVLLAYVIFAVMVGAVIYGVEIDVIAWNVRWLFSYSVIISFLYLVNKKQEIYRFILFMLPFVFFILFTQIYYVTFGNEFINLFNPWARRIALDSVTGEFRPLMGGVLLMFFSYIFSIFLSVNKDYALPKIHLYLVVGLSLLSVFLSATRLWFVIFSFIFVGYMLVSRKRITSIFGLFAIFLFILSALMYTGVISVDMITNPWMRLQQVFNIAEGDIYSVDTAMSRFLYDIPRIAGIMKQNLFLGYGFSHVTMIYYSSDLGFLNTILMFGIIGFALFMFFFIRVFIILGSTIRRLSVSNTLKTPLKIMLLAWGGVLIGYLTTWDFFTMYFDKIFFIALLIALSEFFVTQAKKEEMSLRYLNNS